MSYEYTEKAVISGNNLEFYRYQIGVKRKFKIKPRKISREIEEMSQLSFEDLKKYKSEKEKKYKLSANRAIIKIRRCIDSNPQLNKFLTLTFKADIKDLKIANNLFKEFIKRLNKKMSKKVGYIAVPEYQKKSRDVVHYHLLCDLPYIDANDLAKIWQHGFIQINKIKNQQAISKYVSKYISKDFDERQFGKKRYFCSRNLKKSKELLGYSAKILYTKLEKNMLLTHWDRWDSEYTGKVLYMCYQCSNPIMLTTVLDKLPEAMLKSDNNLNNPRV